MLARVRATSLAALEHQDVPFERLVEELTPTRSLARHPLTQVKLAVQNTTPAELSLPGLDVSLLLAGDPMARLDLDVDVHEAFSADGGPAGLNVSVTAAADLFDAGTAERIAAWFEQVLTAVAADPLLRVHQVPVLSGAEQDLILTQWNDTVVPLPAATTPELFAAQAAAQPDAAAVVSGDEVLSYRGLNEASNRLARLLVAQGAGPESVVAVALDRSEALLIALLAVLKAGAAYLPVDPSYPAQRIGFMLADAHPAVIMTTAGIEADLPVLVGVPVIAVDVPVTTAMLAGLPGTGLTDADRPRPLLPGHPAYVIYTSGSTGTPKGVTVTHAGLPSLAQGHREFGAGPGARVAQFASASFDTFGWEWTMGLLTGAALVIVPPQRRLGGELTKLMAEQAVTLATLPPAVLATVGEDSIDQRTTLIVAGEVCPPEIMARWSARPGAVQLLRPDRNDHRRHAVAGSPARGRRSDRLAGAQYPGVRARPPPRAGAAGRHRRAIRVRRGPGTRICGPIWPDRGAVRGLPVRSCGYQDVPDRRPGPVDRGRRARVRRTSR